MPNNKHRQIETLSIIANKVVEAISITMQQFTEGMYKAAVTEIGGREND